MAYDGIVTKSISQELEELSGARIDKIFQPSKNDVLLGFYKDGSNYLLAICTDSQNYRMHLTTHPKSNPQVAPNFCMVLRKHLLGLRIKHFTTNNLERIVIIDFEGFDEVDDIINKRLIIELMGKHCNIILLDTDSKIIDSLRHTSTVAPHLRYEFPEISKENFLEVSNFEEFENTLKESENNKDLPSLISNTYNGISKSFVYENLNNLDDKSLLSIYNKISHIAKCTNLDNLTFEKIQNANKKDYFLTVGDENKDRFHLNFWLDDYYYEKESSEDFKTYRDSILKLILQTLKKYSKRLSNINQKLKDCDNMEIYKLYGELITANLYKIPNKNLSEITLENYYDNNKEITITLDKRYFPSINAKMFFKKYNKLKNALEIVSTQKEETQNELNYIESVIYELENCSSIEEIETIFEEICESSIFKDSLGKYQKKQNKSVKKSKFTKNKQVSFNPIKYQIDGYTLLVGRNNKENDTLTLKYAKKTDLWFHTKDFHGSHAVLLLQNKATPDESVLTKCAEICAKHSKARNSSNVAVDMCEIKYVKKPAGAKPGMVIYRNNKTFYVNPIDILKEIG